MGQPTGVPPVPPAPAFEPGVLAGKPPRPQVKIAAIIAIVGGALLAIGAALPWLKVGSTSLNGFDTFIVQNDDELPEKVSSLGGFWVFFGLAAAGLGVAMLLAGRMLAVAIVGIVVAALALVFVAVGWSAASDTKDVAESPLCPNFVDALETIDNIKIECESGNIQAGLPVGLVGGFAALGGSIAATARRRRWPKV